MTQQLDETGRALDEANEQVLFKNYITLTPMFANNSICSVSCIVLHLLGICAVLR